MKDYLNFPTPKSVANFSYDGFVVKRKEGFAPYRVEKLIQWTNDPGIGRFLCSDGEERLIPLLQLSEDFLITQEKLPGPVKVKVIRPCES